MHVKYIVELAVNASSVAEKMKWSKKQTNKQSKPILYRPGQRLWGITEKAQAWETLGILIPLYHLLCELKQVTSPLCPTFLLCKIGVIIWHVTHRRCCSISSWVAIYRGAWTFPDGYYLAVSWLTPAHFSIIRGSWYAVCMGMCTLWQ